MTDRGWTDMFGALREREFDRLLTGQVVSTTGEAMIPVALSFAVLDMTDSPTDVGIVLAAGVVPVVLFLLLRGVWADRLPRQRVGALTFLVRAGFLAILRPRPVAARTRRRAFFTELAAGRRAFRSRTWLWLLVLEFSVFGLAVYGPFMVLGPVVAKEQLGGAAAWGLIIASGATGMLMGALVAMRIRPRRPLRLAGLAMLVDVVPFSLLALGGARVTVIITASFAGVSLAIFQIVWQTALQEHVPQKELSRVTAWNWLGLLVFFPLGLVLAGPVSDVLGVTQTLWVSAVTILVLVLIGLSVPSMRNLPSRAAELEAARTAGSDARQRRDA